MSHRIYHRFGLGAAAALGLAASSHFPQDPAAKQLASERFEAASTVWKHLRQDLQASGPTVSDALAAWSGRMAEAAVDAGLASPKDARAQHLARMESLFESTKELYDAGRRTVVDVDALRFHVADAKARAR